MMLRATDNRLPSGPGSSSGHIASAAGSRHHERYPALAGG